MVKRTLTYLGKIFKGEKKIDKRFFSFLFFLLISSVFWFLATLSKPYTTTINYPVDYINFPENKMLVSSDELPDELALEVRAYGFVLLRHKLTASLLPLEIDISEVRIKQLSSEDSSRYYLLTSFAKDPIDRQLQSEIDLLKISPDTLIFQLAKVVDKQVPVIPDISVTLQQQFFLTDDITTSPDSIIISGPHTVLDTIAFVRTVHQEYGDVNTPIRKKVALRPIKNTRFSRQNVQVEVPVEEFTEVKFRVPIRVINVPEKTDVKTFPNAVNISCMVSFSQYDQISADLFTAIVDYEEILNQKNKLGNRAQVMLTEKPPYVKNLDFRPQKVEYIIEKF